MPDFSQSVAAMQPLRQAAYQGNFTELKRLCKENGANVNEAGPQSGKTALHWAACGEDNKIASYLLNAKDAAVDPCDVVGNTPLNAIIQASTRSLQKKLSVIDTLLAHGADVTLANNQGKTPLMNLVQLRDNIPAATHSFQLKSVNALISRIKENIYQKAAQAGQTVHIDQNGQVQSESRVYSTSNVSVMNNAHAAWQDFSSNTALRFRP